MVRHRPQRQRARVAYLGGVAKAATAGSKSRGTFVGTATGTRREHLFGDQFSECTWSAGAPTALTDVTLRGEGLDGLSGGTRRSYRRTKKIGLWLEARSSTTHRFGDCTGPSGSATKEWSKPATVFLGADQCAFGKAPDDLDGTGSPARIRMTIGPTQLGDATIKSKGAGFSASQNGVFGPCSPFGSESVDNLGGDLTGAYVLTMKRLD